MQNVSIESTPAKTTSDICKNLSTKVSSPELIDLVVNDILNYFKDSSDIKKSLRFMSRKINLHEKTLFRLVNKENFPSYSSLYKIYRFIFNSENDLLVLEKLHPQIRQFLLQANPQALPPNAQLVSEQLQQEVLSNPVLRELYVLAGTGSLKKDFVLNRFGQYGLESVNKLLKLAVLKEIRPQEFTLGSAQINFTPDSVYEVGLQFCQSYARPAEGQLTGENYMTFFAEGLSEEAYQQWLQIDLEAFQKKVLLAGNAQSLGGVRAFTFTCTDKILSSEKTK
jgi:hypothetical protein